MSGSTTLEAEFLRASGYFSFLSLMISNARSLEVIRLLVARINESEESVFSGSQCSRPTTLKFLFLGVGTGLSTAMNEVILKAFNSDLNRLSNFPNFISLFNKTFPDNEIDVTSSSVTSVSGGASGAASAVVQEEVLEEEVPGEDVTAGPVASSPGGAAASVAGSGAGSSVGVSGGAGYGIAGGGSAGPGGAPTSARTVLSTRICELLNSWVNLTQRIECIGTDFGSMMSPRRAVWWPPAPRPVLWGAAASGGGGERVLFEDTSSESSSELSFALASPISDGSDNASASVQLFKSGLAQEFPFLGEGSVVAKVNVFGQTSLRLSIPATSSVVVLKKLQQLVIEGQKLEITATQTMKAKC